jgi:hypothetical protein
MAETSKKRSGRIPLDYYKKRDRLTSWRLILSVVAVLVAVAWASGLGWNFWSPSARAERARRLASHGPLTRAHATWDAQCEACHTSFQPIGLATWAAPVLGDSSQSNAKCRNCHAAPTHHASQEPLDMACAKCHHDHQGSEASLVRLSDQHCTQCHSDLTAHMKKDLDRAPLVAETVTHFDAEPTHHPEFRFARSPDPGRLAFNHARHMTPGMADQSGGPVQTIQGIHEPDRARYERYARGQEGTIQLDCAACHELGRSDPTPYALPGKTLSGGAYMLPISYARHCRGCHPLDYDQATPKLVMDHPLQPSEVHDRLWQTYARRYLEANPALLDQPVPPRPMPGRPESPALVEARQALERKVGDAEKILFGAKRCGECHQYETPAHEPVAALVRHDPGREVVVDSTNVQTVWWQSAKFDHSAHEGVSCRACHARAYPEGENPSRVSKDVLLPSIKECLECHSPRRAGATAGAFVGGAGSSCTECHRYHNGDATLIGIPSPPVAAETRATIEQFLLGSPAPGR